ncbi:MAG: hypothetical protein M3355_08045 [Actinomycetota bacterium]|nr:hypothetical protein [Actinomycetota bacterium]
MKRRTVKGQVVVVLAASIVGALLMVASGLAFSVEGNSSGTKSEDCGDGKVATGGGYASDDETRWEPLASQPSGHRWMVSLRNESGSTQKATVSAVCANGSRYSIKSKKVVVSAAAFEGVTQAVNVKCPSGTTLAGGGFGPTTGADHASVLDSAPKDDRTWRTRTYGYRVTAGSITFKARAVCDRTSADYAIRSLSFAENPPRALRGTEVAFSEKAECKASERVTSGGFATDDVNVYYRHMHDAGNGWKLSGGTYSSTPITVYALCLK